jgi:hypothetical protein
MYTYGARVWDLSLVQGPVSVPRAKPARTIRNVFVAVPHTDKLLAMPTPQKLPQSRAEITPDQGIRTVSDTNIMVTQFAASPPTDNCPQPKEAQPLSQLDIRSI